MASSSSSSNTLDGPMRPILITHSGKTLPFESSATLSQLITELHSSFSVPPHTQKLVYKGKLILPTSDLSSLDAELSTFIPPGSKVLLIGAKEELVDATKRDSDEREKKRKAFEYHQVHQGPKVRNTTVGTIEPEYKFERLLPFPPSVPQLEARRTMLERLANDKAIKEIMRRHKFSVGTLTELHPLLQPELLGLNKNAGEEISLRLLTNDLQGTRPYLEVRRVLIHELTHNEFGPHDDKFKTLNSFMTREVADYERSLGLRVGQAAEEPWEPDDGTEEEKMSHTLNEVSLDSASNQGRRKLRFGAEEEFDLRRERMRKAAEDRLRREGGSSA